VDERTGNLPLHFVAAWDVSDPSTISRKSMALNSLLSEYPQAGSVRNRRGKTPMSLSLESGTSWDNGVRRLTSFRKEGSVSFMGQSIKSMRSMRWINVVWFKNVTSWSTTSFFACSYRLSVHHCRLAYDQSIEKSNNTLYTHTFIGTISIKYGIH
jgi:hypothetical protein